MIVHIMIRDEVKTEDAIKVFGDLGLTKINNHRAERYRLISGEVSSENFLALCSHPFVSTLSVDEEKHATEQDAKNEERC